jgi:hypothetical protein
MLKMKIDPAMCMKTQEHMTKCHRKMQNFMPNERDFAVICTTARAICPE